MMKPAYTILYLKVTKHHVLEVVPDSFIFLHPNRLVHAPYLTNPNKICLEIVQADTDFKEVCPAMIFLDVK
jgi:hypothetical protein